MSLQSHTNLPVVFDIQGDVNAERNVEGREYQRKKVRCRREYEEGGGKKEGGE